MRRDMTGTRKAGFHSYACWGTRLLFGVFLWVEGCTATGDGGVELPVNPTDGNQDTDGGANLGLRSGEPNDEFGQALEAIISSNQARLQGTIIADGDIDVFSLGPMSPGDHLVIEAASPNSSLDTAIAIYDDQGKLFAENDDRSGDSLDSLVDQVVRHAGEPYYLAVSSSYFATREEERSGGYFVTVEIERNGPVPEPVGQVVFLDFDGGTISDPHIIELNTYGEEVRPFDGESISPVFASSTEVIKSAIVETLVENFAGLDVSFVTSDEGEPTVEEYSTVMFGSHSYEAFGVSTSVDRYNSNPGDVAVIFTETFTPLIFSEIPRPRDLGLAIGNVAAHEVGHLLGLNHVNDPEDLMDTYAPPDSFLEDQEFADSPLAEQIMDLGTQDALLLLAEIVGLI